MEGGGTERNPYILSTRTGSQANAVSTSRTQMASQGSPSRSQGIGTGRTQSQINADENNLADNEQTVRAFSMPHTYNIGILWCLAYGITRGLSYVVQKVGTDMVDPKPHLQYYSMFRCIFITIFSYVSGKTRGIDFSMCGWKLFRSFQWET